MFYLSHALEFGSDCMLSREIIQGAQVKLSDSFYERSRTAAIWLLRVESLILAGIVVYLLLATVFSTATWPSALIGEIVFASIGGDWALLRLNWVFTSSLIWASTCGTCESNCNRSFLLHDFWCFINSWNPTRITWFNHTSFCALWLQR